MTMLTDADRKVLTEYCSKFARLYSLRDKLRITLSDAEIESMYLFAVYSMMVEKGEWGQFIDWIDATQEIPLENNGDGHAWLFCLNCPEQIGERMKMACDFIRNKNGKEIS